MLAVTAIPFIVSIGLSLTDYDLVRSETWKFIGLSNFADLVRRPAHADDRLQHGLPGGRDDGRLHGRRPRPRRPDGIRHPRDRLDPNGLPDPDHDRARSSWP